jgi:predicted TIM-barrel fold metal-dependent hydrolase
LRTDELAAASKREVNARVAWRFEHGFEHNFDSASQVEAMDREGCDIAVLFRTYPLILDDTLEPEYALAVARAWNDWMTDFCRYSPERLKAACLIPMHDVDMAVDEVRRVRQLGHIAVCMTPEPHNGRHIHDPYYEPLWAELEKLELAATFHSSQRPNLENVTNRFPGHPNASTLAKTFQNNLDNDGPRESYPGRSARTAPEAAGSDAGGELQLGAMAAVPDGRLLGAEGGMGVDSAVDAAE